MGNSNTVPSAQFIPADRVAPAVYGTYSGGVAVPAARLTDVNFTANSGVNGVGSFDLRVNKAGARLQVYQDGALKATASNVIGVSTTGLQWHELLPARRAAGWVQYMFALGQFTLQVSLPQHPGPEAWSQTAGIRDTAPEVQVGILPAGAAPSRLVESGTTVIGGGGSFVAMGASDPLLTAASFVDGSGENTRLHGSNAAAPTVPLNTLIATAHHPRAQVDAAAGNFGGFEEDIVGQYHGTAIVFTDPSSARTIAGLYRLSIADDGVRFSQTASGDVAEFATAAEQTFTGIVWNNETVSGVDASVIDRELYTAILPAGLTGYDLHLNITVRPQAAVELSWVPTGAAPAVSSVALLYHAMPVDTAIANVYTTALPRETARLEASAPRESTKKEPSPYATSAIIVAGVLGGAGVLGLAYYFSTRNPHKRRAEY